MITRKNLHRLGLTVSVLMTTLCGCWKWSFPESLLTTDGVTPGDAADSGNAVDQSSTDERGPGGDTPLPGDGQPPDALRYDVRPWDTARRDVRPLDRGVADLPPHECKVSADCKSSLKPYCDPQTLSCRRCQVSTECASELCNSSTGSCESASTVAYVDATKCSTTNPLGTQANPFCTLAQALSGSQPRVVVRAGTYNQVSIDRPVSVYGTPGTKLVDSSAKCLALTVTAGPVLIDGIAIGDGSKTSANGGVYVTTSTADVTLNRVTVGPSNCLGILVDHDAYLTVRRSLITGNQLGGLNANQPTKTDIENSYFVSNGNTSLSFGGLLLKPRDFAGSRFVNNTVAGNISKGDTADSVAINCGGTLTLSNSLVYGNSVAGSNIRPNVGSKCGPTYCNVENLAPPLNTNLSANPIFVGGASLDAAPWHIKTTSPCLGKGTATGAPTVDYDGDPRPMSPAIGADQPF